MRSTLPALAAWWLTPLTVTAAILPGAVPDRAVVPRLGGRTGAPKVVGMPLRRTADSSETWTRRRQLPRRGGSISTALTNLDTIYILNATLGTPPVSFQLHLDTGSSDLWVNAPSSSLCLSLPKICSQFGTYAANSSSTYSYVGSYFNITYLDNSGASGDYATDTLTISGNTLPAFQFGIGYDSTSVQGVLGIGYDINEVQVGRAQLPPYPNLPARLAADGVINANAYSLYLDDLEASTGSILFGGIDTEQFEGTLSTLPIQQVDGFYADFLVTLTDLSLGDSVLGSKLGLPVLLDSGSSLTYLPDYLVSAAFAIMGAEYQDRAGYALAPCSLRQQPTLMTFSFSGANVSVPMTELLIDVDTSGGYPAQLSDGSSACIVGFAPAGDSSSTLGDTFLRSAYVVYNLDNNEISIAQSRFNATTSNVVAIAAGTAGVPHATAVANPASATSLTGAYNSKSSAAAAALSTTPDHLALLVAGLVFFLIGASILF